MKIFLSLSISLLFLTSCQTSDALIQSARSLTGSVLNTNATDGAAITQDDISAAFKQALSIGTRDVTSNLSHAGAFLNDPKIHIPLPHTLSNLQGKLEKIGLSGPLDDLENRMNTAAEQAIPYAKDLFITSISAMTFEDVMAIYNGPDDSATQFFKNAMAPELTKLFRPSVESTIEKSGVIQAYHQAAGAYTGLLPDPKAELSTYVTEKGIAGLFLYLGEEEKAIRTNPAQRTTALLQKVFGNR